MVIARFVANYGDAAVAVQKVGSQIGKSDPYDGGCVFKIQFTGNFHMTENQLIFRRKI